jgi:hypothetical protein
MRRNAFIMYNRDVTDMWTETASYKILQLEKWTACASTPPTPVILLHSTSALNGCQVPRFTPCLLVCMKATTWKTDKNWFAHILIMLFLTAEILKHRMRWECDYEWSVGKDLKGDSHGLFHGAILVFTSWKVEEKCTLYNIWVKLFEKLWILFDAISI